MENQKQLTGRSKNNAIVAYFEGEAEMWLFINYPSHKVINSRLEKDKRRVFEIYSIHTDGKKVDVFFDVTSFYSGNEIF